MSQETQQDDVSKKRVVYEIPGMEAVTLRLDVEYPTGAGVQLMDLYHPAEAKHGARIPAVVFVSGYSDVGMQKMLGCKLKEMGSYISWAQLVAASGMVAVTYSATEPAGRIGLPGSADRLISSGSFWRRASPTRSNSTARWLNSPR